MDGDAADKFLVRPGQISGRVVVPGDKSISHRIAILAGLADGPSTVEGFLKSEDCLATLAAMRAMGVEHQWSGGRLTIEGVGLNGLSAPTRPIDCGNSGTTMRLLCGLLSAQPFFTTLIGDPSLMRRPMERVAAPLSRLGASIRTDDGHAPLTISASSIVKTADTTLEVASAQVKTALMLAALYADGDSTISAPGLIRDHSERLFPYFGADCETIGAVTRVSGPARLTPADIVIPGDFSSAAFLIVAACIAGDGETRIDGVSLNPSRTVLLDLLRSMGADIDVEPDQVDGPEPSGTIRVRQSRLTGIEVPISAVAAVIDEFPVLCVAASRASGATVISGAAELRIKESDRIDAMATALKTLGIRSDTRSDGMTIHGGIVHGGTVASRGDHRIAMALTVLGLVANAPVTVTETACVATSFPGFVDTMRSLAAVIDQEETA